MNSEFIFRIKKIEDELHTIFTLKEFNVSVEAFFNKLQQIKYRTNSKISIDSITAAGRDHHFNNKGIRKRGKGYDVKVEYSWYDIMNKLCTNYMLFSNGR